MYLDLRWRIWGDEICFPPINIFSVAFYQQTFHKYIIIIHNDEQTCMHTQIIMLLWLRNVYRFWQTHINHNHGICMFIIYIFDVILSKYNINDRWTHISVYIFYVIMIGNKCAFSGERGITYS